MDKDSLCEEQAGKPPSRTLLSCLGRRRPYAAIVKLVKRVRSKCDISAEEVLVSLFFFFVHLSIIWICFIGKVFVYLMLEIKKQLTNT